MRVVSRMTISLLKQKVRFRMWEKFKKEERFMEFIDSYYVYLFADQEGIILFVWIIIFKDINTIKESQILRSNTNFFDKIIWKKL